MRDSCGTLMRLSRVSHEILMRLVLLKSREESLYERLSLNSHETLVGVILILSKNRTLTRYRHRLSCESPESKSLVRGLS